MFEMPNTTPAWREAMDGRIELCRPEQLPRLIKMARREEAIADDQYQHASLRLRRLGARKREPRDFAREIREVLLYVEPKRWSDRSESYKEIAKRLEELRQEIRLWSRRHKVADRVLVLDGVWKGFSRGGDWLHVLQGVSLSVGARGDRRGGGHARPGQDDVAAGGGGHVASGAGHGSSREA